MTVSHPHRRRVAARQVQRRVLLRVQQVGDQAEHLGGLLVAAVFRRRVHGVLDDPHGQRRAVALAGRLQFRQVGAVGQDLHRLEGEGRRGAPQDVRPGGEELPRQRPGQELPVRQHQHPRPEASLLQQVAGQRLLAVPVRADRRPEQAPGPGLGRRQPPHLRERPVPRLVRRPAEVLIVGLAVRHVRRRPVHGHDPQPAAGHPWVLLVTDRSRDLLEQEPDRCRAELAAAPGQRGDVRRPPPPPLPRVHPAVRVQMLPVQQVRSAALVIQAVGQLGHHLPVAAVPAPEQPQRQHEVHHQPGRQQPAPLLPDPGRSHRRIHQLRCENPGQDTNRDPVRQPPVRRQPLRTIMRHRTVKIPHQILKQGHWALSHGCGRSSARRGAGRQRR